MQHPRTKSSAPAIDRRIRSLAQTPALDGVRPLLAPLFPLGLPGGTITIASSTALWLRRRDRSGGANIVAAALLGWLVHRGVKIVYRRERPRVAGVRRRTDSFPSGHTTGTTALALTAAYVLRRERLISRRKAAAVGIGAPLLMGAYRVIADEHWATDVAGGWLLGAAIALGCGAFLAEPKRKTYKQAARGREPKSSSASRRARPERSSSRA
jgi:membrane-associated phospholipid phosphatase